jgi:hypothetical protein
LLTKVADFLGERHGRACPCPHNLADPGHGPGPHHSPGFHHSHRPGSSRHHHDHEGDN